MATKSKAAAAAAAETSPEIEAQEAHVKQEGKPADSWDEIVTMVVPRKPKGEDQQYYICVNDRRFMVPADGKTQELPRPVAEILTASVQAEYAADDFADHIPNRSGDNPQQHAI